MSMNMTYEESKQVIIDNLNSRMVQEIKDYVPKCDLDHLVELCCNFLEASMNDEEVLDIVVLRSGDCANLSAIFINLVYLYIEEKYEKIKEFSLAFYNLIKNYCTVVLMTYPEYKEDYKTLMNVLSTMQKTFNIESNFNRLIIYSQYLTDSNKSFQGDRIGLNISRQYLESLLGSDLDYIEN